MKKDSLSKNHIYVLQYLYTRGVTKGFSIYNAINSILPGFYTKAGLSQCLKRFVKLGYLIEAEGGGKYKTKFYKITEQGKLKVENDTDEMIDVLNKINEL